MRRQIPDDVRPQSVVLLESDRWLIGVPLTRHANDWWGSLAAWCTSLAPDTYSSYMARGPLLIFWQRESSWKWQLHPASGEFRDLNNKPLKWRAFLAEHPDVMAAFLWRERMKLGPLIRGGDWAGYMRRLAACRAAAANLACSATPNPPFS